MRADPVPDHADCLARHLQRHVDGTAVPSDIDTALLDAALEHGVAPLLYDTLHRDGRFGALAPDIGRRLSALAREALVFDEIQRRDLRVLWRDMQAAGIPVLVFKGAALATSHYAETWLRPRGDADLLVAWRDVARATSLLEGRGFARLPRPSGFRVAQARFVGTVAGAAIAYDLHWRFAEPLVFGDCLTFDELDREAVTDRATGIRRPGDVHALFIACVHRVAHHYDVPHLLTVSDIDRLARRLSTRSWDRLVRLARERGVAGVCRRGLTLAARWFDTPTPDWVPHELARAGDREPASRFLDVRLRPVDILWSDLMALTTWRARGELIVHHLFPPKLYLLARYGSARQWWTATLYLRRISAGLGRWIQPLTTRSTRSGRPEQE